MSASKKRDIVITLTFFISAFANAMIYTQLLTYLIEVGFSSYQRGLILTGGAIIGFTMQFLVGYLTDRFQSIRTVMITLQLFLQIFVVLSYTNFGFNIFYFAVIIAIMSGFHRLVQELLESWIFQLGGHYGWYRSFASIGWSIGSSLVAYIVVRMGYLAIGWSTSLISILIIGLLFLLEEPQYHPQKKSLKFRDIFTLLKSRNYVLLVLTYFLIMTVMSIEGISVIELMIFKGIGKQYIGFKFALSALIEVPFFIIGGKIIARYKPKRLLMLSIAVLGFRFIFFSFADAGYQFLLMSLIGGATYPLINIVQHELAEKHSPDNLKMSGQMLLIAVVTNIPSLLTPLLASSFSQLLTLEVFLLCVGLFSIVPLLFASTLSE